VYPAPARQLGIVGIDLQPRPAQSGAGEHQRPELTVATAEIETAALTLQPGKHHLDFENPPQRGGGLVVMALEDAPRQLEAAADRRLHQGSVHSRSHTLAVSLLAASRAPGKALRMNRRSSAGPVLISVQREPSRNGSFCT